MRYVMILCCCTLLAFAGCKRGAVWMNADMGIDVNNLQGNTERIIVSAPAQIDEIVQQYPAGREAFARQAINHLQGFVANTKFYYAPNVPDAGDVLWENGPVSAVQGAHLVLLFDLLELKYKKVTSSAQNSRVIEARVQLRVLDKAGKELWRKVHSARKPHKRSPKFSGGSNLPASRAIWDANRKCIVALKGWLDVQSDREMFDGRQAYPYIPAHITLTLDSVPSGADVLINGELKGTTPCVLKVMDREITLRIERAAYLPWQRIFTPSEDMALKPSLQAVQEASKQ